MINSKRYTFFWISWIAFFLFSPLCYVTSASTSEWTITLSILWFGIRHGTPDNVNLWTPTTSATDQEISGQFSDYFRIEDLQWYSTWHYTTIQCDGIYGSAGNRLTGVYLKAGNPTPTKILWTIGNVYIWLELTNYTNILTPVTYLYKPTDISNLGIANKYWDKPWLKIFIPGWTPPGMYSGTIVFSFYSY